MAKKEVKKNYRLYFYCLAFLVVLLILLRLDFQLSNVITGLRFDVLSSIMIFLSATALQIALMAAASIIVCLNQKKKLLQLWLSYAITLACSYALKIIIARPRPFEAGISTFEALIKESYSKFNFSFPSNHAAMAFVPLLFLPKKWRLPWLVLAILIAVSRFYLGLHYLSDVLSGAALAIFVSYIIIEKVKL